MHFPALWGAINQKVRKRKQGKKINFTMNKDIDRRTVENGQENPIYINYSALMILLLKMASESNNDWSAVFSKNTS